VGEEVFHREFESNYDVEIQVRCGESI
jgi:methylated-DNA-[protein]-cysteine S-methyltransferase